jgi:hypothetical protein
VRAGAAGLGRLVGALHDCSFRGPSTVSTQIAAGLPAAVSGDDARQMPGASCSVCRALPLCRLAPVVRLVTKHSRKTLLSNELVRWGNPLLEQKPPLRSNTCTTNRGLQGPLTWRAELWITSVGGPGGAYNATALRRTCPQ